MILIVSLISLVFFDDCVYAGKRGERDGNAFAGPGYAGNIEMNFGMTFFLF